MQFFRLLLVSGPPEEVEAAERGHAQQVERLRGEGRLRLAGTFANGDGYCEILDVKDRHEAESLTRESPLVERGLVSWILREWNED